MIALLNPFWGAAGGGGADPYFANVQLLCHFDSSSGNPRTYVNESSLGAIVANASGTVPDISAAQSKFGGFSLAYGASGNSGCRSGASPSYSPGTGDFTEEFFFRIPSITTTYILMDCRTSAPAADGYCIYCSGASGVITYITNNIFAITSAGATTVANQWMHVAVARAGTSTRMFIDGNQVGSTYSDSANYNQAHTHTLGNAYNWSAPTINCYYDEWRITVGVARYTSNFTAPVAAFPDS